MMLDREHWKKLLPVIQAYADGEDIQYRGLPNGSYHTIDGPLFNDEAGDYRIKPKPTYRPFNAEDLPTKQLGALTPIRRKDTGSGGLIYAIAQNTAGVLVGVILKDGPEMDFITFRTLLGHFEYLDGTPCGVLVDDTK